MQSLARSAVSGPEIDELSDPMCLVCWNKDSNYKNLISSNIKKYQFSSCLSVHMYLLSMNVSLHTQPIYTHIYICTVRYTLCCHVQLILFYTYISIPISFRSLVSMKDCLRVAKANYDIALKAMDKSSSELITPHMLLTQGKSNC